MNIIKSLREYLKLSNTRRNSEAPEGICPNCWGREEYGGQFFEKLKNHSVDVNRNEPEIGWITDYAEKHLKGIKLLKKDDALVCQQCKYSFRPEEK